MLFLSREHKEEHVKRYAIAAATALSVALGAQALAQNVAVEIAPDQRTIMKEYVVKEKVRPVTMKEKVAVGVTLPTDVELLSVPSTWGPSVSKYRYVYNDNRVVLVEPSDRRVVQVIE
jgi:hypothetical protein